MRQKNLVSCIRSMVAIGNINMGDTVLQFSRCSFDIHLQDIIGTLILGDSLIMLHPEGTLDLQYFARVLQDKQITYIHTVPTFAKTFFGFITDTCSLSCTSTLRSVCTIGE